MIFAVTSRFFIYLLLLLNSCYLLNGQNSNTRGVQVVSDGISDFSMNVLNQVNEVTGNDYNVVLSTYSVWLLLAILNTGAVGATSSQIMRGLGLPADRQLFYQGFSQLQQQLSARTAGVELDLANAVFVDSPNRLNQRFIEESKSRFNVSVIQADLTQRSTAIKIDTVIRSISRGKIQHFINLDDLKSAVMLLTTAVYFKGSWSLPFNRSATFTTDFYDETLSRSLGQVEMMYQIGPYAYTKLSSLPGHVIELPYGSDSEYSMLVVLPMKNVRVAQLLNQLTPPAVEAMYKDLERAKNEFLGDDVLVYLPKFAITSDLSMNIILEKLGISNVFHPANADLSGIAPNLYLSRVIHKAIIEVDEDGTVASAVTEGTISYKAPPAVFNASHPFIFMIIHKQTRTPLFVGKFSNPKA